jgi:hypothetical protein
MGVKEMEEGTALLKGLYYNDVRRAFKLVREGGKLGGKILGFKPILEDFKKSFTFYPCLNKRKSLTLKCNSFGIKSCGAFNLKQSRIMFCLANECDISPLGVIHHKDENERNNEPSNLEYVTQRENIYESFLERKMVKDYVIERKNGTFVCKIFYNGYQFYWGPFSLKEEALKCASNLVSSIKIDVCGFSSSEAIEFLIRKKGNWAYYILKLEEKKALYEKAICKKRRYISDVCEIIYACEICVKPKNKEIEEKYKIIPSFLRKCNLKPFLGRLACATNFYFLNNFNYTLEEVAFKFFLPTDKLIEGVELLKVFFYDPYSPKYPLRNRSSFKEKDSSGSMIYPGYDPCYDANLCYEEAIEHMSEVPIKGDMLC